MQKYRFSNFNIIFLDINLGVYDIKSFLGLGFFMPTSENTIYSVFKSYEPLEKMSTENKQKRPKYTLEFKKDAAKLVF